MNRSETAATTDSWGAELRATLALGFPLILANLAQAAMGVTDVVLMGRLGPAALAAGSLATNLYQLVTIAGIGLLSALMPMIAASLGHDASDRDTPRAIVRQGLWSAVLVCLPAWVLLGAAEPLLLAMGQRPELAAQAARLMHALQWGLLPAWFAFTFRSVLSAFERPLWGLALTVPGVALNALLAWGLMFGKLGLPAFGLTGAGIATTVANAAMALGLALLVAVHPRTRPHRLLAELFKPEIARLAALWRLGIPLAVTVTFEASIFSAVALVMGLLGPVPLAAHAVALQLASLTFMVPLGFGQAASVRVGLAYGARNALAVTRAGWSAYGLGVGFMAISAVVMLAVPGALAGLFLDPATPGSAAVQAQAVRFLAFAALFQIVDGAQAVGAGMLRGLHDTRIPMIYAGLGYWGLGLPLGVFLAFGARLGGEGLWMGLVAGLAVVAILMTRRWARQSATFGAREAGR